MTTYRRLGYIVRPASRDVLAERLERAGARLTSLNRLRPRDGHRYTECPRCGRRDGLWLDTDGTWSTLCGCAAGGNEIDLVLFLRRAA